MEHRFNFFRVCILYCFFNTEYVMGVYVHSSGFLFAVQLNVIRNEKVERTTDPGQATGKRYHLRLRVECTLL